MKTIQLGVTALVIAISNGAYAQLDVNKPITIIVPYAAGGPTDMVARTLATALSRQLKDEPVKVENVGGAGGTYGAAKASKAAPDGYTLLLNNIAQATAPALYPKLTFDPVTDFEPIGEVVNVPMTLIGRRSLQVPTFKELVSYMRKNKDTVKIANAGVGSASFMCGLLLLSKLEVPIQTIPYKGTALAMKGLQGGQVDIMCDQTTNTMEDIQSKAVNVYGVTTKARLSKLPEVPTMTELGAPDVQMLVWHGLFAPKGTPQATINHLSQALQGALLDPAFTAKMSELGADVVSRSAAQPHALRALLKSEIERWGPLIRKAGIYAE